MTIDEGSVKIRGDLKVLRPNSYTSLAPVWIRLDETTKNYLRGRGGIANLALYVPSPEYQKRDSTITQIASDKDPALIAPKYGTMVALLSLRRIKQ